MQIHLGQKIKKLRELKGLTQEDVSDKLRITQSNYSKMEIGKLDIPFSKLEEIATVLNIPVEDIICFNENLVFNIKNNKKANGLVINQMSLNEKKIYEEYIESLKTENTYLKTMIDKLLGKKNKQLKKNLLLKKIQLQFPQIENFMHVRGSVITNWQKDEGTVEAMV